MRFRPCIDIHNGKVKQIVGSSLRDQDDQAIDNFVAHQDAAWFARMYAKDGLAGGHIILLNPPASEFYQATKEQAIKALLATPGKLQIGGGINPDNAAEWLDAGASHLIVTSYVFKDGIIHMDRLEKMKQAAGKEHLVLDLSCRRYVVEKVPDADATVVYGDSTSGAGYLKDGSTKAGYNKSGYNKSGFTGPSYAESNYAEPDYIGFKHNESDKATYRIVTDRWQKMTDVDLTPQLLDQLSDYCDEFLVHAVDVEGKSKGIEEDVVRLLGSWGKKPVTYAGGVSSFGDLDQLRLLGNNRVDVTIGSALDIFGGHMAYRDVLAYMR